MVSEIKDVTTARLVDVWIPEFGIFDTVYLEPGKKYQGRLYRLSSDALKMLSEAFGFTARFDSPSIRTGNLDVSKGEGRILFEIDRNTKPTDLNLRYSRDLWNSYESSSKEKDALRPWIKTFYSARFFPEKISLMMADQIKIKPEDVDKFYVRINLKEKTVGLIAEDQYIDQFPSGPFQVFALPEGHIATIPVMDMMGKSQEPGSTGSVTETYRQVSGPHIEPGVKYATYSKSEIDRMLRLQSDSITNTLSSKISGQQRIFQDAVSAQEKSFTKITDRFATTLQDTHSKLESHTQNANQLHKAELEVFKAHLTKELDNFKTHVNKNIIPISKTIEEKIQALGVAAKPQSSAESLKPLIVMGLSLILAVVVVSAGVTLAGISDIKAQLSKQSSR